MFNDHSNISVRLISSYRSKENLSNAILAISFKRILYHRVFDIKKITSSILFHTI